MTGTYEITKKKQSNVKPGYNWIKDSEYPRRKLIPWMDNPQKGKNYNLDIWDGVYL